MAYTASFLVKTVMGNQRVEHIRVTADAASGTIDTGLSVVDFLQHSPQSASTAGYRVFQNSDEANSNTVNGQVGMSGLASGDVVFMTVFGH